MGFPHRGQNHVVEPHPEISSSFPPQSGHAGWGLGVSAMTYLNRASISLMIWFFIPRFWKLDKMRMASSFCFSSM